MFRVLRGLLILSLLGGLCSCGAVGPLLSDKPPNTTVPEVPPQFRRSQSGDSAPVTRVTLDSPEDATPEQIQRIRDREKDLVWTDPDNPETALEGMEEAIARGTSHGPWQLSFTEARRASMRDGKPALIWFTDSEKSPLCRSLSAEVFSTKEFESWAEENVVRLRLDFSVTGEGEDGWAKDADRIRKEKYLEKLKERYKVLGLPSVLVLAPDGTVTGRYRGYERSYGDFYFKRLQFDTAAAEEHHLAWKESMERRGYRIWTGAKGRTVFAKLLRYDHGDLILVEPDGKRLQTNEKNLSRSDRQWIDKEKGKRE